jgi:hypothetical protein
MASEIVICYLGSLSCELDNYSVSRTILSVIKIQENSRTMDIYLKTGIIKAFVQE